MAKRRKEPGAGDLWLDRLVDEIYQRMGRGERPSLSRLLEELLHRLMERERQPFRRWARGNKPTASIGASCTSPWGSWA